MYNESDAEFDRLQAEAERIDAIVDEEYDSRMKDLNAISKIVEGNADLIAADICYKNDILGIGEEIIENNAFIISMILMNHDKVIETVKRCVRNECEANLNL